MESIATNAGTVITLAGELLGLLAEFPLNILVVGLVAGVAFRLVRGAKGVARG